MLARTTPGANIDPMADVIDNPAQSRFELTENGSTAFADYRRDGDRLILPHVEAPPALRGTGTAGRLMEGLLALVRSRGERVVPVCSYAVAYLRRHPCDRASRSSRWCRAATR